MASTARKSLVRGTERSPMNKYPTLHSKDRAYDNLTTKTKPPHPSQGYSAIRSVLDRRANGCSYQIILKEANIVPVPEIEVGRATSHSSFHTSSALTRLTGLLNERIIDAANRSHANGVAHAINGKRLTHPNVCTSCATTRRSRPTLQMTWSRQEILTTDPSVASDLEREHTAENLEHMSYSSGGTTAYRSFAYAIPRSSNSRPTQGEILMQGFRRAYSHAESAAGYSAITLSAIEAKHAYVAYLRPIRNRQPTSANGMGPETATPYHQLKSVHINHQARRYGQPVNVIDGVDVHHQIVGRIIRQENWHLLPPRCLCPQTPKDGGVVCQHASVYTRACGIGTKDDVAVLETQAGVARAQTSQE
ncbi:hypothetical protein FPV67DRAFT_1460965 [Lyophyllum atratum]|nr:hypothetical protein FPV67DRAFT_1460965 [Lyophyllum atratum]